MSVISQWYKCVTTWRRGLHPCGFMVFMVAFASVATVNPFCRGMSCAVTACGNQTAEEDGKGFLVPDLPFGWSLFFQQLAVKKEEVLEPTQSYILQPFFIAREGAAGGFGKSRFDPHATLGLPREVSNQHGQGKCVTLTSLFWLDVSRGVSTRGSLDFSLQRLGLISAAMSSRKSWLIQQGCSSKEHMQRLGKFGVIFGAPRSCTMRSHSLEEVLDRDHAVQEIQQAH